MLSRNVSIYPLLAAALLLAAGCQEDASVGPAAGSFDEVGYVNVRHEPQHRHEFENEAIRIYDVLLPPGYVTLHHAHTEDTIYLVVRGSTLRTKALIGSSSLPIALPVPSGTVLWSAHKAEPVVHEVTNEGDGAARLVGVELKYEQSGFTRPVLSSQGLQLDDTYAKVRVYDLTLEPGESTAELDIDFSGLMIAKTEASVTISGGQQSRTGSYEPASWELLEAPGKLMITNVGISTFNAMLYEYP
ncbi:hypothetical protein EYC98_19990 [Halieaceae bacterium IMCC14734]|uniref:Uncharacterized protein n=1 Tax=Candidatus Litorirhabdus singularis TaxID=2518993 RepID=A0ABT3TM91_9GAMM|nr:hypothetical protein [Candidatus Litorirhabdus singularis]MCX2983149.1 hypothetical protein [Candidatus Litorirhabdus singularis]